MSHIHEKIDFTVDVFVVHENKVLLRMHDKYHLWLAPGGHIELHEDPNEAALREVKEEVGLDVELWNGHAQVLSGDDRISILIPPISINRHNVSPEHEHISLVYFATTENPEVTVGDHDDQSHEWKWFMEHELEEFDIPKNIRDYAHLALEALSFGK